MHTGYYFGFFLAAIANYFIGANYGWRWMFIFGGVAGAAGRLDPERRARAGDVAGQVRRRRASVRRCARRSARCSRRRTSGARSSISLLFTVSIIGLWAGSIYVPTAVTQIAVARGLRGGRRGADGVVRLDGPGDRHDHRLPRWRRCWPNASGRRHGDGALPDVLGVARRHRLRLRVLPAEALTPFFVLVFFLGIGGANFAHVHAVAARAVLDRLPRQRDRLRQLGRPVRRRGDGVHPRRRHRAYGSLGVPVAVVALAFVLGLVLLPFARETRGQALPA